MNLKAARFATYDNMKLTAIWRRAAQVLARLLRPTQTFWHPFLASSTKRRPEGAVSKLSEKARIHEKCNEYASDNFYME